jgi:hypothetical protein
VLFETPATVGAILTVWWPFAAVETIVAVPPSITMPAALAPKGAAASNTTISLIV